MEGYSSFLFITCTSTDLYILHFAFYIMNYEQNSCPLCQEEGIAEEVRSYDIETEAPHADTIDNVDAYNRRLFNDGDAPA